MRIDTDSLRDYLLDYCGTAMFGGFPAAVLDVSDIESISPRELCETADRMGVDLCRFEVDED